MSKRNKQVLQDYLVKPWPVPYFRLRLVANVVRAGYTGYSE
jgi:hypothetical protein